LRKRWGAVPSGDMQGDERSEPLKMCQKVHRWRQNRAGFVSPGEVWEIPVYYPDGVRHECVREDASSARCESVPGSAAGSVIEVTASPRGGVGSNGR
jgi:hypothetical protein